MSPCQTLSRSPPGAVLHLFQKQRALDVFDDIRHFDVPRTGLGAIEDRATAPDTRLRVQDAQALGGALIAAVVDEASGIHDCGGADEALVCPGDWTRGRAWRAKDEI